MQHTKDGSRWACQFLIHTSKKRFGSACALHWGCEAQPTVIAKDTAIPSFRYFVCGLPLFFCTAAFGVEQRDFPTGGPGAIVTYLDAGGHFTTCIASVGAGLPAVWFSVSVSSNSTADVQVSSEFSFPAPRAGSDAGITVGSAHFFGKIKDVDGHQKALIISIKLIDGPYGSPVDGAYQVIKRIIYGSNPVSVVADDAVIASGTVPQQSGLGDAMKACQQYMISRR